MSVIYVPGWGYPAHWWCNTSYSWGYFEEQSIPDIGVQRLIVHSWGLYMLPEEILQNAQEIFWYGAFFELLPFAGATLNAFMHNPEQLLCKFVRRMFWPQPARELCVAKSLESLLIDLKKMVSFDYQGFWNERPWLKRKISCFVGSEDRIIGPLSRDKDCYVVQGEGHMPNKKVFEAFAKGCRSL